MILASKSLLLCWVPFAASEVLATVGEEEFLLVPFAASEVLATGGEEEFLLVPFAASEVLATGGKVLRLPPSSSISTTRVMEMARRGTKGLKAPSSLSPQGARARRK